MLKTRFWLTIGLLVVLGGSVAPPPHGLVLAARARVAPADTVRAQGEAGAPFILTLPATVADEPVAAYEIIRAPALSWLVGRSFYWRTRPADAGTHTLLFRVGRLAAASDTLALQVEVQR